MPLKQLIYLVIHLTTVFRLNTHTDTDVVQTVYSHDKLTSCDLANCGQRCVTVQVVPQSIMFTVHVDAVLVVTVVVWLPTVPVCPRQRRAPHARHKRSLRRRVTAVDVYQVDRFAYMDNKTFV